MDHHRFSGRHAFKKAATVNPPHLLEDRTSDVRPNSQEMKSTPEDSTILSTLLPVVYGRKGDYAQADIRVLDGCTILGKNNQEYYIRIETPMSCEELVSDIWSNSWDGA